METIEGTVVWFNNAKGFGFVTNPGGADVFVHFSSIQSDGYKTLKEGDRVQYRIGVSAKGPQAEEVVVLGPSPKEYAASQPQSSPKHHHLSELDNG